MTISPEKLKECEGYINNIEKILPPIKTFFVSGGTELASLFDISRTLARKAERRVVSVFDEGMEFSKDSLAYLNRLSSLLYAMARLSNHIFGLVEDAPSYK
jgi:cob(I)alamin adenosyltransferase